MKSIKRIIITGIISLCYLFCHAQMQATPEQWAGVEKKMVKSSPYIFEGKVIKYTSLRYAVLTCFVVQITKIYRGSPQLKLGTIKVIIEQDENTHDGGPFLAKGYNIIFGSLSNSHIFDSIATDNTIVLTYRIAPVIFRGKGAQWGMANYPTRDSLYSFFRENGLTVQEQIDTTK